jgi:protein-S-isoprenylcysteine O-methyltransferase Ste14
LFFTGANLVYHPAGKQTLLQKIKQQRLSGETSANFILNLAWRALFHAVLFTAIVALLIDIKTVRHSPLFMSLVVFILLIRLAELFGSATDTMRHYRKDEDQSRLTSWIIGISFLTNVLAPVLESRYKFWSEMLPTQWWNWLGLILFVAGSSLRIWAIYQAGASFLPHVKVDSKLKLVTAGPYVRVRHPSYLGLLISYLGIAILFNSLIGAIALAVLVAPAIVLRIVKEEQLLANRFGEAWKNYQTQTPVRLIPTVW